MFAACAHDDRILVTADTDFGALLALTGAASPSVLLLRGPGRNVDVRVRRILNAMDQAKDVLRDGALVVVEGGRIRIRKLPMSRL